MENLHFLSQSRLSVVYVINDSASVRNYSGTRSLEMVLSDNYKVSQSDFYFLFFLQSVETVRGFLLKPSDTSLDKSANNCNENKNTFPEPSFYEEI